MTSPRTDARAAAHAAAAERRAAASSRFVAFEADDDAPQPTTRRRAPPSAPAPSELAPAQRPEFSRKPAAARTATPPAPLREPAVPEEAEIAPPGAATDSSGPGWFGWMAAAVWFGLATGSPLAYWGLTPVLAQPPAFLAGLVALAVFPALGLLMVISAARDAAAARALAQRLGAPRPAAAAVDAAAWRAACADAEEAASAIADLLARERAAAGDVAAMLKTQTEASTQAARRQVGLMREASRLVTEETRAVETTLADAMAAITGAQATLRADVDAGETVRQRLDAATEAAAETHRLLEDTTATAFDAADAVRAAAQAAMADARHAADAMRAQAEAARADMQDALSALERAAHTARAEARAAAEAGADLRSFEAASGPRQALRRPTRMPAPVADSSALHPAMAEFTARDATLARDLNLSWMTQTGSPGVDMLETMGVSLADAIADTQFAAIRRRSRLGVGARRRAVTEAAPDTVDLISRVCERDERVRRATATFRRDPGFDATAPMDEWPVDGAVARAYLLVDAALA